MEPIHNTVQFSAGDAELLRLGSDLGQNEALGHVKGYCAAARVAIFQRLKDEKIYKRHCATWDEFCPAVLKMSRSEVDRQIATLNEFGPRYFAVAELAPVSPENFRLLESSVQNDALIFDGESIPLVRENAQKVAKAVAILRQRARQSAAPTTTSVVDEVAALRRRVQSVLASFEALSAKIRDAEGSTEFTAVLEDTMTTLYLIASGRQIRS